jgi:hypothetical protein
MLLSNENKVVVEEPKKENIVFSQDDFPEIEASSTSPQNSFFPISKDKSTKTKKKKGKFADVNIDLFKDIENNQKNLEEEVKKEATKDPKTKKDPKAKK